MKGHYNFGSGEDRQEDDFYATDPKVIRDLYTSGLVKPHYWDSVWENGCGDGILVDEIKKLARPNAIVAGTDIKDRSNGKYPRIDFLSEPLWFKRTYGKPPTLIVTNPPYSKALEWVKTSLDVVDKFGCVALLLKTIWLAGGRKTGRYKFFKENKRLTYVLQFASRVNIYKGGIDSMRKRMDNPNLQYGDSTSNTTDYAWFIWYNYGKDYPMGNYEEHYPMIKWVPPK